MSTTKDKITIMQAYLNGKKIEYRQKDHDTWKEYTDINRAPSWLWTTFDYRIKNENLDPEFEKLVSPLMEYLNRKFYPHCQIVITSDSAELFIGQQGYREETES